MKINAVYQISDEPRIYLGMGSKHWGTLSGTKENKTYLLAQTMWHFNLKSAYLYWKFKIDLKKRNVELIPVHNSPKELLFSKLAGLSGFFANHNLHVCEHNFSVIPGIKKSYDAVYIAAAKKYKRIHLAKKIKRLFIVTYFWPEVRNEKGEWDLHAFEPEVIHADFNRDRIGKDEINRIMNMSCCGLALSKKEGAMFASMEYQLAGLPVVTTPSLGGRDEMLDPLHTTWVKSDPDKIAAAVDKYVQSPLDQVEVRNRTLSNLDLHRKRFYEIIKTIYSKHNKTIEPYDIFCKRIWGTATGLDVHCIIQ